MCSKKEKGQSVEIVLQKFLSFRQIIDFRGPYRGRTGDLHNAIVALSQTELTAQIAALNIPIAPPKVNEKVIAVRQSFGYLRL